MSSTQILKATFGEKVHLEVGADEVEGQFTAMRLLLKGQAVATVVSVLELGTDYMTVSEGGHIRHIRFDAIASMQVTTNDPNFLGGMNVSVTGQINS